MKTVADLKARFWWDTRTLGAVKNRFRDTDFVESRLGRTLLGHRAFVGGMWDEIGELQRRLLLDQGMTPDDVLLDVGCGSLRGGRHFIPYLKPGHYVGLDQYPDLVKRGLATEVPSEVQSEKRPRFIYTDTFAIPELSPAPTFALGLSLFTHLTHDAAELCLRNVRPRVAEGCRFYVTFFESERPTEGTRTGKSHSLRGFWFSRSEMEAMGAVGGWDCRYIGDWGHPRNQHLIEYVAA